MSTPKGALPPDSFGFQIRVALPAKDFLEGVIGDPSVGDSRFPAKLTRRLRIGSSLPHDLVKLHVHVGVHPRDKEARDGAQ